MMKYEYMYAYAHHGQAGSGYGRVFITRPAPIATRADIEEIEVSLNERNNCVTVTLSFQLLRTFSTKA